MCETRSSNALHQLQGIANERSYMDLRHPRYFGERVEAVIEACGVCCKKPVLAAAWLELGSVRLAYEGDEQGARAAFARAFTYDRDIDFADEFTGLEARRIATEIRANAHPQRAASDPRPSDCGAQ